MNEHEQGNRDINETLGLEDEDRLPWLESADDYRDPNEGSLGKTLGLVLLGLVALAAIIGSYYWMQRPQNGDTQVAEADGSLIEAAEGDYKVPPKDPQGQKFEGTGDASFKASEGQSVESKLATGTPGAATAKTEATPAAPATSVAGAAKPGAAATPAAAAPAPVKGGAMVQLGAFSSAAKADAEWQMLSSRTDAIRGLTKRVEQASVEKGSVFRLRAAVGDANAAAAVCAKVKAAGAQCAVVR